MASALLHVCEAAAPSRQCELQPGLQDPHQWHDSHNDLSMGNDAAGPAFINMTPAGLV